MAAAESYPDDLKYHEEHDWARVEGDEAVVGITWFAADALGELVHFEAPEVGATVTKNQSYGEVESVKAVSDLIAPLSGEVLEVNGQVVDAPETVNEDPYGTAGCCASVLRTPARSMLSSTSAPTRTCWPGSDAPVPRTHRFRPGGDARDDRCRLGR